MGYFALSHYLDLAAFAAFMVAAMGVAMVWVRRSTGTQGYSLKAWLGLTGIVTAGMLLALGSGEAEGRRQRETISGLAPTYADEMSRAGLAQINAGTPADDPTYLRLIARQIRWQKDNPTIADIYTFGRNDAGQFCLLVDSETDYNHNGVIDEEREQRTPIGEVYEEDHDLLTQAIGGTPVFTPQPTTDRWGTWISEYVPVFNDQGEPYAILGVDFDAREYIHSILWHRGGMLSLAAIVGLLYIGTLGMLATLRGEMAKREVLHKQLVEASRQAGMADIAAGVLHNVGNALNSVNTSATVISEKIRQGAGVDAGELAQVAGMFRAHAGDLPAFLESDEVGRQLPAYFAALADAAAHEQAALAREMQTLGKGIDHIRGIVQAQQSYAGAACVLQEALAAEIFDEAVAMSLLAGNEGKAIAVAREFSEIPPLRLDRHKLVQILLNLINNAAQATARQTGRGARITLRLKLQARELVWEVADNGAGITAEGLTKIFQPRFTTRREGHGFGLHSAANAAGELGGTLKAASPGAGQGAVFTLRLPIGIQQEVAA